MDKRVQRSRAALLHTAVRLVSARGTTAISVTELADAAGVSRQLIYLRFGDRDALLVAAAADLVTRELLGQTRTDLRHGVLATTRHLAEHRSFYRAMLTGSCAYAMTRTLTQVFSSLNQRFLQDRCAGLDEDTAKDLALFLSAGAGAVVNEWLVSGDQGGPLDPDAAADRLLRLAGDQGRHGRA